MADKRYGDVIKQVARRSDEKKAQETRGKIL